MKQKEPGVTRTIALQSWLRPALTPVGPNKDYEQFRDQIWTVDELLKKSHLESMAMDFACEGFEAANPDEVQRRMRFGLKALRVEILRKMLGNISFRQASRMIASSDLLADFCGALSMEGIKGVSKSTLDRLSDFFTEEQVRWMMQVFVEMCGEQGRAHELGLPDALDTGVCLIDSTCLEANIHFPVDWVLLRDVAGTLLKATTLIRKAGLRCRMPMEPTEMARWMNKLCINMTHARRRKNGRRLRKATLRQMKNLLKTIGGHARRHRDRLEQAQDQTEYTPAQARRIVERIDRMLEQLPRVIEQAHERIIGERKVPNDKKILSVHEDDVQVLVRGKAGKEVEFGNTLTLSEAPSGLITDWWLYRQAAPAEWRQLQESLERQNAYDLDPITDAVTDRGFAAKRLSALLAESEIHDATCPRDPNVLKERMKEERFAKLQRRRASTEARIAIVKERLGGRPRSRGHEQRALDVAWGVVAHNLWLVARLLTAAEKVPKAA